MPGQKNEVLNSLNARQTHVKCNEMRWQRVKNATQLNHVKRD
jgi:hypothetical protein